MDKFVCFRYETMETYARACLTLIYRPCELLLMGRAMVWLNLYGREAVRHKLKKGLKSQKMHFLTVFELMSDSLTTILVEPHQCPSHQSILLTQEPIHEIFEKYIFILWLAELENKVVFESAVLIFCFISISQWKQVKVYWLARMGQNFDHAKRDNTFWPMPNILKGSVLKKIRVQRRS